MRIAMNEGNEEQKNQQQNEQPQTGSGEQTGSGDSQQSSETEEHDGVLESNGDGGLVCRLPDGETFAEYAAPVGNGGEGDPCVVTLPKKA
jgi:hypothetical protein